MIRRNRGVADVLTGLASGDTLKTIYNGRSKSVDEKTVSAASAELLALKVAAEEADGWRVSRLEKSKSIDRQLEDDVWSLLYRLGFEELNNDRNFSIQLGSTPARQLYVFAKDNETVFIVECTHSREGGTKSVKSIFDKLGALRDEIVRAIHTHYGREPKLKVKFAIAVRNMEIRPADIARSKETGIQILTDVDLRYFNKLVSILRHAARYQFLGRYLHDEKVDRLRETVPATRGRVSKTTFYNFLISPHDLLRISYIIHMAKDSNDDLQTYQRMVETTRLKAIGAYIDAGGTFPTNIVINLKKDNLHFDQKETFGDTATGILHLPAQYGVAWVIDGQHRLYGYVYSSRTASEDKSVVSVLAYQNLPVRQEIEMFVVINSQQKKVSRNLVNEIISNLNVEDPDPKKRLEAMCARSALKLNS